MNLDLIEYPSSKGAVFLIDRNKKFFEFCRENNILSTGLTDCKVVVYIYAVGVYIADIEVCKELRGYGIGNYLLSSIKKRFKGNSIYLEASSLGDMTNQELISWYERNGFAKCSVVHLPVYEESVTLDSSRSNAMVLTAEKNS